MPCDLVSCKRHLFENRLTRNSNVEPCKTTYAHAIETSAADPDAPPSTEVDVKRMKRTPQAKIVRRALELTKEDFSLSRCLISSEIEFWFRGLYAQLERRAVRLSSA